MCLVLGREGSLGDFGLDVLAGLKSLLPSDDLGNSLDEDVDQLGLRFAKTVGVGDVPAHIMPYHPKVSKRVKS